MRVRKCPLYNYIEKKESIMAVQTGTGTKEKAPKVVVEKKVDNSLKEQNDLLQKRNTKAMANG